MTRVDESEHEAEIFCRRCGYDLRGLPAGACPECGRSFDPSAPSTYRKERDARGGRLHTSMIALALTPVVPPVLMTARIAADWIGLGPLPFESAIFVFYMISLIGTCSVVPAFVGIYCVALADRATSGRIGDPSAKRIARVVIALAMSYGVLLTWLMYMVRSS